MKADKINNVSKKKTTGKTISVIKILFLYKSNLIYRSCLPYSIGSAVFEIR